MKTLIATGVLICITALFSQCKKDTTHNNNPTSDTISYNITLKGKLVDCNDLPIANGYAMVNYRNYTEPVASDSTGTFSVPLYYHPSGIDSCLITGINENTRQQGKTTKFLLSPFANDSIVNIGNIVACGDSTNTYVSYSIDGGPSHTIIDPIGYSEGTFLIDSNSIPFSKYIIISGRLNNPDDGIIFYIKDNATDIGVYPIGTLAITGFDPNVDNNSNTISAIQPLNVTVTNFAQNVGDYYKGNFSGQFTDSSINSSNPVVTIHTINCSFNVVRTQ